MRPLFGASRAWLGSLVCKRGRLPAALYATMFIGFMAFSSSGCEDQAIGRTCKTLADKHSPEVSDWNDQALECPSRLCIEPSTERNSKEKARYDSATNDHTAAFCTAECSSNSDCEDSQTRDLGNPKDRRCTSPFVCAVLFTTGPLKCQKMCVCGDFYADLKTAVVVPPACQGASGSRRNL